MKKYIITIIILVIIIIVSLLYAYRTYENNIQNLKNYNTMFENYKNKEIQATEIATILNQAININTKNNIPKDTKGNYIENDTNSIKIEIYIKDNDTTYPMETIYNMGVEKFINSFSLETFKLTEIKYHETTNKVKYLKIEQQ